MTIIVDSGSTKTTWACLFPSTQQKDAPHIVAPFHTHLVTSLGINPIRDKQETIEKAVVKGYEGLCTAFAEIQETPFHTKEVHRIFFYGAGCIPPYSTTVKNILQNIYPNAVIKVESDMVGAALALCGHHEGIACILGTGSNSCLFDGQHIVAQTPALGFILGDEGSGASLGRRLVGDVLKKQLPEDIQQAFFHETKLSQPEIINRVYCQPQPNTFLASLTVFLEHHLNNEAVRALLVDEFRCFLQRNIRAYNRPDLPVHFVGGITATYQKELKLAIKTEGMRMGKILSHPITGIVDYHLTTNISYPD